MSKYTTEVRFICEQNASLEASVGGNKVNEILDSSWDKIFDDTFPIFNEEYRPILCKKILKHYYTREICAETVGLWKLWLNTRMEEIMPYYNQLYESELLKFEPLTDVNYSREFEGVNEKVNRGTDTTNKEQTENANSNNVNRDLYSDTPQGSLKGVENETYLTDARKVTDESNSNTNSNSKDNREYSGNENGKNKSSEVIKGKQGATSFSELLIKYRKTFLNIDMMIIDELSDLFFGLW